MESIQWVTSVHRNALRTWMSRGTRAQTQSEHWHRPTASQTLAAEAHWNHKCWPWQLICGSWQPTLASLFSVQFSSVQPLNPVRLFATPWIAARQASLSITNPQSLLKPMSIESVMPSNHLILCGPLFLLPLHTQQDTESAWLTVQDPSGSLGDQPYQRPSLSPFTWIRLQLYLVFTTRIF